jgi:Tfp pilus assembly protein PilV
MPTRRSVNVRAREESGFGLIELVIAMFMLNIGILALVAAFNSGAISLRRASHTSTAASLADSQMELYRALTYAQIGLDTTAVGGVDNTYMCDVAMIPSSGVNACPNTVTTCITPTSPATCPDWNVATEPAACALNQCNPSRSVTAANSPDHYPYRIDSYIRYKTPTNGRQLKEITVVVRDGNVLGSVFARQTSTFDPSTAG